MTTFGLRTDAAMTLIRRHRPRYRWLVLAITTLTWQPAARTQAQPQPQPQSQPANIHEWSFSVGQAGNFTELLESATDAFAARVGEVCAEQNEINRNNGYMSCQENYCLAWGQEQRTPPTLEVSFRYSQTPFSGTVFSVILTYDFAGAGQRRMRMCAHPRLAKPTLSFYRALYNELLVAGIRR